MAVSRDNQVGQFIASRRKMLHLTQEDIAHRLAELGIERKSNTIANWETGQYEVPRELFEAVAKALEMSSPAMLYELAGVLDQIPGGVIVKLLKDAPQEEIDLAERLIRAMLNENK